MPSNDLKALPEELLVVSLCHQFIKTINQAHNDQNNENFDKHQLYLKTQEYLRTEITIDTLLDWYRTYMGKVQARLYHCYRNDVDRVKNLQRAYDLTQFTLIAIKNTHKHLLEARTIAAKEEAQKKEEAQNSTLIKFRKVDDPVDKFISFLKTTAAILKVLTDFAIVTSVYIKPLRYVFSLAGDAWGFIKSKVDTKSIARKTGMSTSALRFARSVTSIILFILFFNNPLALVLLVGFGTAAGMYRDLYISIQNRIFIKEKKEKLRDAQQTLAIYEKYNFSYEIKQHQTAIIKKHADDLNQLKKYRSNNNVRLQLDFISAIGFCFCLAGVLCPPFTFFLTGLGVVLISIATTAKTIHKFSNDAMPQPSNYTFNYIKQEQEYSKKVSMSTQASLLPRLDNQSSNSSALVNSLSDSESSSRIPNQPFSQPLLPSSQPIIGQPVYANRASPR